MALGGPKGRRFAGVGASASAHSPHGSLALPQVDPRKCQQVITKLLYLLTQGETFTKAESSDVFFSVTKLFMHKDFHLRRMVYLCIKEFIPSSEEVIIITSSLMKDMNNPHDLFRANAIRVLCKIIDGQMLLQIERYLKQAIVDKSPVVAAAVLAGALQLAAENPEVVKRWNSEIQEALSSRHPMVQFHAVALQHALRSKDRLAISKLVTQLTKGNVRSPYAQLLLVRYVAQVIADTAPGAHGAPRPFYDYLESCLRHRSEIVIFEAARAIVDLKDVSTRELTPAISVLQLFLSSSKPTVRFAAVKTLNKVAMSHPSLVANCNIEMESLIADSNRSIATLAITTLLKTGNEGSIDRLMKQIGNFIGELADEFKIVVVEAVRSLCIKFPAKHRGMLSFLSMCLREDGGFSYKKSIVDAILAIIRHVPEAKDVALNQLSEFIEDCEFTFLSVEILHLLGEEGPKTKDPARHIRVIYNRVILENATVRAAALSSLARFGLECDSLRDGVIVLLRRALFDSDDEVRDRATLYLSQLGAFTSGHGVPQGDGCVERARAFIAPEWLYPAKNLVSSLEEYLASGETSQPFDLSSVPKQAPKSEPVHKSHGLAAAVLDGQTVATEENRFAEYAEQLKAVPELADLGPVFKTCAPVQLTEEETEYHVLCVHHVLGAHDVFQFHITNTVPEQVIEDVSVLLDLADAPDLEEDRSIPLAVAPNDGAGQAYVVLRRTVEGPATGTIASILKFKIKEIDPATGEAEEEGFDDEYQLEDLDCSPADYVRPAPTRNFSEQWESLGQEKEVADQYALGERESVQEAVEQLIELMGMSVCDGTNIIPPNARSHAVSMAGTVVGDVDVYIRMQFGMSADRNVAMKLAVRSANVAMCEAVHGIIQNA